MFCLVNWNFRGLFEWKTSSTHDTKYFNFPHQLEINYCCYINFFFLPRGLKLFVLSKSRFSNSSKALTYSPTSWASLVKLSFPPLLVSWSVWVRLFSIRCTLFELWLMSAAEEWMNGCSKLLDRKKKTLFSLHFTCHSFAQLQNTKLHIEKIDHVHV